MRRLSSLSVLAAALAGCQDAHTCPEDSGTTCIVAGTGRPGFNEDGLAARESTLYAPMDVEPRPGTIESVVVDWNNHRIRHLLDDGTMETIIGTALPGDGDPDDLDRTAGGVDGTTVGVNHPVQALWAADGSLVLPQWHNHRVRQWNPETGLVRITAAITPQNAGSGANSGFAGDGGPAAGALFFLPVDMTQGPDGAFYVVDQKNQRVRRMPDDWSSIQTVVGNGTAGFAGDGGPALDANLHFHAEGGQPPPSGGITAGPDGRIYISDTSNHCIRAFDPAANPPTIELIAGTGTAGFEGDGAAMAAALFNGPRDLAFGPDGLLYVADTDNHRIRAIDLDAGTVQTVAGSGAPEAADREYDEADDGVPALETPLDRPYGIGFDDDGVLFVADTWNHVIRRIAP